MANPFNQDFNPANYAVSIADRSYEWYRGAAIKARRFYRLSETLQLTIAAAIPVSAVLFPENAGAPAVLGGFVVLLTGLRSIFHWQDDYLRFSEARESIEAERRLYRTHAEPYDEMSRDQVLIAAVTRIEHEEMGRWKQLAIRRKPDPETYQDPG